MTWLLAALHDLSAIGFFLVMASLCIGSAGILVVATAKMVIAAVDIAVLVAYARSAEKQGVKVWREPAWVVRYSKWRHGK